MKKILIFIITLLGFFSLSGCGKNEENSLKITFDNFILTLPDKNDRTNINPSTITDTQIIEKLIKILKNKSDKELNIIISKTEIKRPDIDFKTFVNANLEKFNKLVGYKLDKLEFSNINCNNKNIPIAIHLFELDQSLLNSQRDKYYYSQIYIYLKNYGYIIQVFSTNKDKINSLTNEIIQNLKCKKS